MEAGRTMTTGGRRQAGCGTLLTMCLLVFLGCGAPAASLAGVFLDTTNDTYAVLTGYGQSFPGWGQTTQRVETIDLVLRHNHHVIEDIGSGWYRGFHSTIMELPIHIVTSPDTSTMIALNFLATYTFTANPDWQPYIFGGGGPVYSFADIPGMSTHWNGNYQGGIGLEHPISDSRGLLFELRFHHISNAGLDEPNEPLNSVKVLFGLSF